MTVQEMIELLEEFDPNVPVRVCCSRGGERWLSDEVALDPERTGSYSAFTLVFDLEGAARC